jgi:phosphatidylinositol alpha-mannosyltransferase
VLVLLLAGIAVYGVSRLHPARTGHALVTATPGWIVLAFTLMSLSLLLRSLSWFQTLRAALPDTPIAWSGVARATMIGVLASAVLPGRIGEPSRVFVVARRLEGARRRLLAVVAGTVFSQALINLLALAVLAGVTFSAVPLHGRLTGLLGILAVPVLIFLLVVLGPRLLGLARRSRVPKIMLAAEAATRTLALARRGLLVFAHPRSGVGAVLSQLLAWALQWLACYAVLLSLGLQSQAGPSAAAAILLAVNASAILPATPSNVGVFQAACLVVLAAYGVGAGPALAYGIILQAIEVLTALALGIPALLREGLTWREIRAGESDVVSVSESPQ